MPAGEVCPRGSNPRYFSGAKYYRTAVNVERFVQVPEGRQEQAATGTTAVVRTPSTVVGTPVALVQPQAGGDRRPVAQVPAERVRRRGRCASAAAADQPVGQPVVRDRVQLSLRAAVPDGRGDEREQAARGRAQGRAAGGGRGGVQRRVRGTLHGRAQGAERGRQTRQPHRTVRVRGRGGAGGCGLHVRAARPVRAASGRPAGGQPAAEHRAQDGRGADGRRVRADGQLPEVSHHAASGHRR